MDIHVEGDMVRDFGFTFKPLQIILCVNFGKRNKQPLSVRVERKPVVIACYEPHQFCRANLLEPTQMADSLICCVQVFRYCKWKAAAPGEFGIKMGIFHVLPDGIDCVCIH